MCSKTFYLRISDHSQPAYNALTTSPKDPFFVETSRTILGPKQDAQVFTLLWQCIIWYLVGIRKNRKKSIKIRFMNSGKTDIPLRMRPLPLHIGPYGDVLRTSGYFSELSSGRPWDVILPSGLSSPVYNIYNPSGMCVFDLGFMI